MSNKHSERILLTGSTGFIGQNIISFLNGRNSSRLIYIDRLVDKNDEKNKFNWNNIDEISDNSFDVVIHLAGKAHDTKNTTEELEYFDINVGLTKIIFQKFINSSATKFIYFSSIKAVSDSMIGEFLTEEDIPNPKTPYGKSKFEAENYILSQKLPFNKKVYILRPCMIHGPGNKGNLNLLYKIVKIGIPWPLGAFENKRSFLSISNLMFIIKELIGRDIESGIYNLSDDEFLSTNEIIKLMSLSQNKKVHIWNIPQKLIIFLSKLGDYLYLPLNSERLKKLTESYTLSNKKLKKNLGLKKMPLTSKEGMIITFESFKKQ